MSEDDRRNRRRVPAEVKVDYRTVGSFITDYSTNISKGGLFVTTSLPLSVGERVRLRLTLPGHELPFALDGVVRWVRVTKEDGEGQPGMGVEFVEFDERTQAELERIVSDMNRDEEP